jgi:hypothetical protein
LTDNINQISLYYIALVFVLQLDFSQEPVVKHTMGRVRMVTLAERGGNRVDVLNVLWLQCSLNKCAVTQDESVVVVINKDF